MKRKFTTIVIMLCSFMGVQAGVSGMYSTAAGSAKLTGSVIGTEVSYDYNKGCESTEVNTRGNAFDGDVTTFFATRDSSLTWCGLDLGTPHVITRVGCAPYVGSIGKTTDVQLAVFEGANTSDFTDAVPLYLNVEEGESGMVAYYDVAVKKAFRYVRYIGPADRQCRVAEVEFWGYEGQGAEGDAGGNYYRPTNLPVVTIHSPGSVDPVDKENDVACTITIIPSDGDASVLMTSGTFRFRGNISNTFPKHPYRIKFDKKQNVLDAPAKAKKWTLLNNYEDKTLMRNMVAYNVSSRFGMEYTPYCRPVDVFVNGEYKGSYQLCDQVEIGENRINGESLLEADGYAEEEEKYCWFQSAKGVLLTIKDPDIAGMDDDAQKASAQAEQKRQFDEMEALVYDGGDYRQKLDVESFLKFFLINEFCGNLDIYWSSNMYKHPGEDKYYMGPVWDFDTALGNDWRLTLVNVFNEWIYRSWAILSSAGTMNTLAYNVVERDSVNYKQLKDMWCEARTKWNVDSLSMDNLIDGYAAELDASQKLNFMRWPVLGKRVGREPFFPSKTYAGEVKTLKTFLEERIAWMDKKLEFSQHVTGVSDVRGTSDKTAGKVYTLDGRCVGNLRDVKTPGMYIYGGKKLLVK